MNNKTLRSERTVYGRNMAGARSLWRANGMKEEHFGKPVIAIVNSFSQFVPGHVHLHNIGQVVKRVIESQGLFAAEFNTIAIDDGIAMGHEGMLYSLPSRELIADSVEYVCNAHCADAMICISNCDKITPGMLMAAMRLNIPAVFISGGPMEAGKLNDRPVDLIDAMVAAPDSNVSDEMLASLEQSVCPTCGSCSGMFTANSMNCLTEALGLALPGNGTVVATHRNRLRMVKKAAKLIVALATRYYYDGDETVLPRSIASYKAFSNAMALDIAMGGSTNTVLHLLAVAHEAGINFSMKDIDELSRRVPNICRVAPSSRYHVEDVNRAGGVMAILGELERNGLADGEAARIDYPSLNAALSDWDIIKDSCTDEARNIYKSAPGGVRSAEMGSQEVMYDTHDTDRVNGCIRSVSAPFSRDGGLAVLYGNMALGGCIVKTAGVDPSLGVFTGRAVVFESQEEAVGGILGGRVKEGNAVIIRYEGPAGGPGMQEMLYPTSWLKSMGLDRKCALITDGRFSGGTSGLSVGHVSPEAAAGGTIALIRDGDEIKIDIPGRTINVTLTDEELTQRRASEEANSKAFRPKNRNRQISGALRAYATFVSSADKGAVRII